MAVIRSSAISESGIVYFSSGGHNHDGINSTIIDTTKYSIFDFGFGIISTNSDRVNRQTINQTAFKNYIISVVNSSVLEPAGVVLQDNIINSRNIIAGSITATEIAANTITANNIAANTITSVEIAAGTITANNIAAGTITGDLLAANTVTANNIAAGTITADKLAVGALSAGSVTISGSGDYWNSDGTFRLGGPTGINWSGTGDITFGSGVSINGTITSTGTISGGSLSGVTISTDSGSIGGWTIASGSLSGGSTYLYSDGTIVAQILKTGTSGARIEMGVNIGSGEEVHFYDSSGTRSTIRNPGSASFRISTGSGTATFNYSSASCYLTTGGSNAYALTTGGIIRPANSNAYSLGFNTGLWTEVWATNGTIQTSDSRLKTDILDSNLGLDFINQLRPVSYKWIEGHAVEVDPSDPEAGTASMPGIRNHYGFISQEVKQALDNVGCSDFAGWILSDKDDPDSTQSLRYSEFISPLVKAVQELSARVQALEGGV